MVIFSDSFVFRTVLFSSTFPLMTFYLDSEVSLVNIPEKLFLFCQFSLSVMCLNIPLLSSGIFSQWCRILAKGTCRMNPRSTVTTSGILFITCWEQFWTETDRELSPREWTDLLSYSNLIIKLNKCGVKTLKLKLWIKFHCGRVAEVSVNGSVNQNCTLSVSLTRHLSCDDNF